MDLPTTFFGWVMFLVERYYMDFLRGLGVTLELAIIGTILGCLIGFGSRCCPQRCGRSRALLPSRGD